MSTMKIITPQLLETMNLEPAHIKLFGSGISFNRSAQKKLALEQNSRFVILQDEKDNLFYQDAINKDGFVINHILEKGGCRTSCKNLLKFLYPERAITSISFEIGEFKNGMRLLTLTSPMPKEK